MAAPADITLRDPAEVMRLSRLGSFHQSRLSFMRVLTRRLAAENWQFTRAAFDIDANGVGHAFYSATGPDRTYSLVAFAHDLPADQRSDRVIAEAWDTTFALFDGVPTKADITRLSQNVPLQEAGRVSESELSLSRANRSVRLWTHFIDTLAAGKQPDADLIDQVGYLMRTTAVYGSGKFGAADREVIADRPECEAPFQIEMLSVYLTRWFVRDLMQHMANTKGGANTAQLDPALARRLGIGNSTGLGMAPFLINHPRLFNNWILARETAIKRVRSLAKATPSQIATFRDILQRSLLSAQRWNSEHPIQVEKLANLLPDLAKLAEYAATDDLQDNHPWDRIFTYAQNTLGVDAVESLASMMLEPYGHLVDGLAAEMADKDSDAYYIDGRMTIKTLAQAVKTAFGWAENLDWQAPKNQARAWYVSQEKLEPRLGERFDEPIQDYEQPLAPARDACALLKALAAQKANISVAEFLQKHPEHRHSVRRAQQSITAPYSEIRDNTISATVLPIDMLRCKLSFFGAIHFDPRSDRWVRICMYSGAPYPDELTSDNAEFWIYPQGKKT